MGAIGGMLGLGGGDSGTGVDGPASANLISTVDQTQLQNALAGVQGSAGAQQALLQALQAQNGLGNQSAVFNQLQGVANGTGPNPAQQQFQNNANQLGAQSAGLMGSQKGMSPALQARMVAQQQAGAQQNVAGQGAEALASQQLGAMGAMGNMANNMATNQVGQTNANNASALQLQQNLLGGAGQLNNALVGNQSSINNANSGMAQGIMGNQQAMIGGMFKGASAAAGGMAMGGEVPNGPQSSFGKSLTMKGGGFVPGQAKVAGDSPKNDTVDAKLSPGEIVLPRTVVNSKNPSEAAAKFVAAVMARKGKK